MHGLVRDAERQKMSKTKGNVVDPLELIERYGTDACRMALLVSAAPGGDIALKEDRLAAARNFANKLWNASRLLFLNMEKSGIEKWSLDQSSIAGAGKSIDTTNLSTEDAWILERLNDNVAIVNRALDLHRYHEAAQTLWDFVWHEFCDWYLEVKKLRFQEHSGIDQHWRIALSVYETILRLLHPFMPFITEELWQRLVHGSEVAADAPISISLALYPLHTDARFFKRRESSFPLLQSIVTVAREVRADHKLDPKRMYDAELKLHGLTVDREDLHVIEKLARLYLLSESKGGSDSSLLRSVPEFDLTIRAPKAGTNGSERGESRPRLEKQRADLLKAIDSSTRQLSDEKFLANAPQKVIDTLNSKLKDYQAQLARIQAQLDGMDAA
jgi:valyl-tRNA synthetase